jgi:hypothetical protein
MKRSAPSYSFTDAGVSVTATVSAGTIKIDRLEMKEAGSSFTLTSHKGGF